MTKKRIPQQINLFLPVLIFGLAFAPFPSNKAFSEELQSCRAPNPIRIVDSDEQSIMVELTAGRPRIETIPQQQDKIPHSQVDTGVASNTTQHNTTQPST